MKVSLVVPVFNDADSLAELVERSSAALHAAGHAVEFILVDDGSRDDVMARLRTVRQGHRRDPVILVRLDRNHGQNIATLCGIRRSRGDCVVTLDADLQHPPEEIPRLLEALVSRELGLVYGTARQGHPGGRRLASLALSRLLRLAVRQAAEASSFRALTRATASALLAAVERQDLLIDVALARLSLRSATVATRHDPRPRGASAYSWARLARLALLVLLQSGALFRIVVALAIVASVLGAWAVQLGHSPAWLWPAPGLLALGMAAQGGGAWRAGRRPLAAVHVEEVAE